MKGAGMQDEKHDELTVLCALAAGGLRAQRPTDLAKELGIAASKMTRLLQRLVETGCARQADEGGYVVGQIIELAVRRINEDNAATAERLHAVMEAVNPQPPPGPGKGETILGLRTQAEMHKLLKQMNERMERLERTIRQTPDQANERAS